MYSSKAGACNNKTTPLHAQTTPFTLSSSPVSSPSSCSSNAVINSCSSLGFCIYNAFAADLRRSLWIYIAHDSNIQNPASISFLNIKLSPSLLSSQPLLVRKNGFEHLKVRLMSMSASVIPSITSHPREPFMQPSIVPAPSPTIQGPVASPTVGSSRRHRHHYRHGMI
ncbi:hypothetical protein Ccrd_003672, partial [Cynara cardunculus var. scolymus]